MMACRPTTIQQPSKTIPSSWKCPKAYLLRTQPGLTTISIRTQLFRAVEIRIKSEEEVSMELQLRRVPTDLLTKEAMILFQILISRYLYILLNHYLPIEILIKMRKAKIIY
jgi:hypothetical protein